MNTEARKSREAQLLELVEHLVASIHVANDLARNMPGRATHYQAIAERAAMRLTEIKAGREICAVVDAVSLQDY